MAERNLKNTDQNKAIHAIHQEHLMWTVLTDFSLFLKTVTVALFITLVYFFISDTLYLCDKMKKKRKR